TAFAATDVRSTLFALAGGAAMERAAWSVAVTTADASTLADADGTGALTIEVLPGLSAVWDVERARMSLDRTLLLADQRALALFTQARAVGQHATVELWSGGELELTWPRLFGVAYVCEGDGTEGLFLHADVDATIDRPVSADGRRLP